MVLIISIKYDVSTFDVVDWLEHQNKQYIMVYPNEYLHIEELFLSNLNQTFNIFFNNKVLSITSLWYRRGDINVDALQDRASLILIKSQKKLMDQLMEEYKNFKLSVINTLINKLKYKIEDYVLTQSINKIDILNDATKVGLKIPETIITSSKSKLTNFSIKHNNKIITKPISDAIFLIENKHVFYTYTSKIEDLQNVPSKFFPSLFQQMINKIFELRIFFLKNQFYSAAIFSQQDQKTKVDFRNYNMEKPNRYVPFRLPKCIERKILKLMKKLKIDSCSIDMIVDKNGDYYFLEINPVGQYGMISIPCNYYLDEKISECLM